MVVPRSLVKLLNVLNFLGLWVPSDLLYFAPKSHEDTPSASAGMLLFLLLALAMERDEVAYSFESELAVEAPTCPLPEHSR